MAYTYLLDNIDVTDHVLGDYSSNEKRALAGEDLIKFGQFSLVLWNEQGVFNPYNPASIFGGRHTYESILEIWDEKRQIYKGRVKSDKLVGVKMSLTIVPLINDILDRICIYVEDAITPAQAFYEILTINGMLEYIDMQSYEAAKSIQESRGLLVDINYGFETTTTVLQAIKMLADIAGCDVFFTDGKICFNQITEHDNNVALIIPTEAIVSTIETFNDTNNIRNQYVYETDVGTINDAYVGQESRSLWGERSYNGITLTSGSAIETNAIAALMDAGSAKIIRAQTPHRYCKFSVDMTEFNYPFDLTTRFKFEEDISDDALAEKEWHVYEINFKPALAIITALEL